MSDKRYVQTQLAATLFINVFFYTRVLNFDLWIDEFGSWDALRGSFGETLRYVWSFYEHPPAYFLLLWGWTRVFGTSEIAMRMPSVICVLLAMVVLYFSLRKSHDQLLAFAGVMIWMSFIPVLYSAGFARPYGLSLLFSTISVAALFEVIRLGWSIRRCTMALLFASLAVNVHILSFPILIIAILFTTTSVISTGPSFGKAVVPYLVLPPLLVMPIFFGWKLLGRSDTLGYGIFRRKWYGVDSLVRESVTPELIFSIVLAFLVARCIERQSWSIIGRRFRDVLIEDRKTLYLWFAIFAIIPGSLFCLTMLSGQAVFFTRHFNAYTLGLVGLVLTLVRAFQNEKARYWFVLVLVGALWLSQYVQFELAYREDWKTALSTLQEKTKKTNSMIYQVPGYIESLFPEYLHDDVRYRNMCAPFRYYSYEGSCNLIPPLQSWEDVERLHPYLVSQLTPISPGKPDKVFVLMNVPNPYVTLLVKCVTLGNCFANQKEHIFARVRLMELSKMEIP